MYIQLCIGRHKGVDSYFYVLGIFCGMFSIDCNSLKKNRKNKRKYLLDAEKHPLSDRLCDIFGKNREKKVMGAQRVSELDVFLGFSKFDV